MIANKASGYDIIGDPRSAVELYVSRHAIDEGTFPSLAILVRTVGEEFKQYGSIGRMPPSLVAEIRNDMYLVSESLRLLMRDRSSDLSADDIAKLRDYQRALEQATKFIPLWVKIVVAIVLGAGTMIGWKRIVITVGERIGKARLSVAQGACAEITAAATIAVADGFGPARVDDPCALVGHRRNDDGKRRRPAMADGAQHPACVGVHPAGRDDSFRWALLDSLALFSSTTFTMNG